jgi:two-component system, OmpR family, sensor histidine kinase PrrB
MKPISTACADCPRTGLTIALRIDHRDRSDLDRQMTSQADKVRADVGKLLTDGGQTHPTDEYGDLLQGSQSLVRLLSDPDPRIAEA